jgi:predicted transcriptional regulator YheO
MHPLLAEYRVLVAFLGKALGAQYEVVLHDLTLESPAIVAIANNHSGRTPGAPLTDLALRFVAGKVYEQQDYEVNYRGVSKAGAVLRSSTMFIKDEAGQLIGMLCLNYDTSAYLGLAQQLAALFQMQPPADEAPVLPALQGGNASIETFSESIGDVVQSVLRGVLEDGSIPPDRLTQEEKLAVVEALSQKGIFLLKGSVSEVARLLCSPRPPSTAT